MRSLDYYTANRFNNSGRVFAHSFNSAAGWTAPDQCRMGIERQSPRLAVLSSHPSTLERSKELRAVRTRRKWRSGLVPILLAAALSAFFGVALAIVVLSIRLAPDKLTLQKDAAALTSLENQSGPEDFSTKPHILLPPPEGNTAIETVDAQPEALPR